MLRFRMSTPSTRSAQALAAAGALAAAAWKLGRTVALRSLWRLVGRLPVACALCLAATLATAAALLMFARGPDMSLWGQVLGGLLLAAFAVAGCLWGLQRAFRAAAIEGLITFHEHAPPLLDLLLAPLAGLVQPHAPTLAIADVRGFLRQTADAPLPLPRWRLLHPLQTTSGWLARWWWRGELAAIEGALAAAEAEGQTHVTLDAVRRHAIEQCSAHAVRLAHAQLCQLDLAVAAIVFLLLVIPAGLFTWAA